MSNERVFAIPFAKIYPLYVQKVERKGRTRDELDRVLGWLTGYSAEGLQREVAQGGDLRQFFAEAPEFTPRAALITGTVCGVRVEAVEDPLMRKIRCMDKLVDELAKGKAVEKILRG